MNEAELIHAKKKEFTRLLGLPAQPFIDELLTVLSGKFILDIVGLDDWMAAHRGYDIDRDGSLEDFIRKNYGDDAVNFINENI